MPGGGDGAIAEKAEEEDDDEEDEDEAATPDDDDAADDECPGRTPDTRGTTRMREEIAAMGECEPEASDASSRSLSSPSSP
jgi:hypothetical protein